MESDDRIVVGATYRDDSHDDAFVITVIDQDGTIYLDNDQWYEAQGPEGLIAKLDAGIVRPIETTEYLDEMTARAAEAIHDGATLIQSIDDGGYTGVPNEFWIMRYGRRFLVTVIHDPVQASDKQIDRSFDAHR